MNIYQPSSHTCEFIPTYLYIKKHLITGMLYLGKTNSKDPAVYLGSGTYWKRHIKKHGREHVATLWFCLFTEEAALVQCALLLSEQENIVESTLWANLTIESGLNGGAKGINSGITRSEETRAKMSVASVIREANKKASGYKDSDETRARKSKASARSYPPEVGARNSIRQTEYFKTHPGHMLGKQQPKTICPHCGKEGGAGPMSRFHFDNCKLKS